MRGNAHKCHLSDKLLCRMVQWEPLYNTLARQSLKWLGHVARMNTNRRPKQALFGWARDFPTRNHAPMSQHQWLQEVLNKANVPNIDWFRLAQDRKKWFSLINKVCPREELDKDKEKALNKWWPGKPVPFFFCKPTIQ